jgi:arsenate reductase (glutaredoxin)
MNTITLYGIPNCDTVKKARAHLATQNITYVFYDFKKQGVPEGRMDAWLQLVGWEKLLNRKGTTWRKLDADVQASVVDAASAKAVMMANASVIKRPVIEWLDGGVTTGFTGTAP